MSDAARDYERRRQARRLERRLASGRAWTTARFTREVLGHSARAALAARILFESDGRPFVPRDGAPRGLDDEEVPLGEEVRVAHPAELTREVLGAWGDRFAALRLRSPFDQLARAARPPADGDALPLAGLRAVPPEALTETLLPRGWARGEPDETLRVSHLVRAFRSDAPVAVLGLSPGLAARAGPQRVVLACFEPRPPGGVRAGEARLPLGVVPARWRSEVLYDLALLPC